MDAISTTAPPWARDPPHNDDETVSWSLTEIKGGVELAHYPLREACTWFGRAADLVHIVLQHESCSRIHARIAFDASGTPWLRDLQSSHGTLVNKKRMPQQAIGRLESDSGKPGSRGVVIYPGDIIQFGASTRIFSVEGPPDFPPGTPTPIPSFNPESSDKEILVIESSGLKEKCGTSDDEGNLSDNVASELNKKLIPEKLMADCEKIKALKLKHENIRVESEKIEAKDDLTQGQRTQLKRNEDRLRKVEDEMVKCERNLIEKLKAEGEVGSRVSKHLQAGEESDDAVDDFFDRTAKSETNIPTLDPNGETEESLIVKWKATRENWLSAKDNLSKAQDRLSESEARVRILEEQADEEAFFARNDLEILKSSYKNILDEKKKSESFLNELSRLLKVVNQNIMVDLESGKIASMTFATNSVQTMLENKSMRLEGDSRSVSSGEKELLSPPLKRLRAEQSKNNQNDTVSRMATLPSVLEATLRGLKRGRVLPEPTAAPMPSAPGTAEQRLDPSLRDQKADTWLAPTDQDGSGFTRLNAKFGGRY